MSEPEKQEGQKTVVAFIVGLLIGGLLVMLFSGSPNQASAPEGDDVESSEAVSDEGDENTESSDENSESVENTEPETPATPTLVTGDGEVDVSNQTAGNIVRFDRVVFPIDEGWVAVRSYEGEQLGNVLGASRFSNEQGLVPESVQLLAPTVSGREYAVVFFTEDGDRRFNLATDVQIDGIFGTFSAE